MGSIHPPQNAQYESFVSTRDSDKVSRFTRPSKRSVGASKRPWLTLMSWCTMFFEWRYATPRRIWAVKRRTTNSLQPNRLRFCSKFPPGTHSCVRAFTAINWWSDRERIDSDHSP